MLVRLPSGALAPLETPSLAALLDGGGELLALARATLAHEEVDADALPVDDLFEVARFGLDSFAAGPEGVELADTCTVYHEAPSRRLRITEPVLAYAFDRACALWLRASLAEAEPAASEAARSFAVPDPWRGEDDD